MTDDITFTGWRKSSLSFSNGNCAEVGTYRKSSRSESGSCVEAGTCRCGVAVRDTKSRGGPVLMFGPEAWQDFSARVRRGEAVVMDSGDSIGNSDGG